MRTYKSEFHGGEDKSSIIIGFRKLSRFNKLSPAQKRDAKKWMGETIKTLRIIQKTLLKY